jgi:hypothetical protein
VPARYVARQRVQRGAHGYETGMFFQLDDGNSIVHPHEKQQTDRILVLVRNELPREPQLDSRCKEQLSLSPRGPATGRWSEMRPEVGLPEAPLEREDD